jgi:type IV secretion system protein VirD4
MDQSAVSGDRDAGPAAEAAVVCVTVVAGGLAGGVWAGAQAAALLFGEHHSAGAGFRDALMALPRLAGRPADPRSAWPAGTASRLPGPGGYWAATALVLAGMFLLAGAVAAWASRSRAGVQRRRRLGVDPEARLARGRDLAPLRVRGPVPGRLVLGRVGSRLVATEDRGQPADRALPWRPFGRLARRGQRSAVVVIGPSQCGKTAALAIPAILEWAGPLVALSVKSDLMAATIARRRARGEVRVFDPVDVTWEASASWSPLREASTISGARRAARSIANATNWTTGGGEMAFWVAAAEDLLATLFWTAAANGLGIDTVVGWVLGMDQNGPRRLAMASAAAAGGTAGEARQVLEMFDAVWRGEARQVSSVYLTARQVIRPWQEPGVQATAADPRLDLDWLLDCGPGGTAANSLYLCADLDDAERLAPVLGGLIDDLFTQAYTRAGKDNTALDPPLLVVIDEAGNWPMRNLPARISTCAGLGIQVLLVFQSKAQIDAAYGDRADIVLANAVTKVFFAGLSDESTLRYAALLLGSEHVTQRSATVDSSAPLAGGGRRSLSEAPTQVDLLPASQLRQITPGQALLVHGTLPPAHLHGRYWYLDPDLYCLATGRPRSRRQLARQARRRDHSGHR